MHGKEFEEVKKSLLHILAEKGHDVVTAVDEGLKSGIPFAHIEKDVKKTLEELEDGVTKALHGVSRAE